MSKLSKDFVLAGNATITIETPDAGHRTYKIEKTERTERWDEAYFVKMLTGSDNETDYTYIGKLDAATGQVHTTKKSKLPMTAYPVRLLTRVLICMWANNNDAFEKHGFQVHHEGKCGRCGRKLTVPESIESGIGPECSKKLAAAF